MPDFNRYPGQRPGPWAALGTATRELDPLGDMLGLSPEPPRNGPPSRLAMLEAALVTSAELDTLPDPEPLIDGWLYLDGLAWLHGKKGNGKTFAALDIAGCIAAGLDWHGHAVKQAPVVYVYLEGVPGLKARVRAWEAAHGRAMAVTFLPVPVHLLADADALAALAARRAHRGLMVIDTQAQATAGLDENSPRDAGLVVAAANWIHQASHACVLIVHHEPRSGENLRGHGAIEGAATTIIRAAKDGRQMTLTTTRQKDAEERPPLTLTLAPHGRSLALVDMPKFPPNSHAEDLILTTVWQASGTTGGISGAAVVKATGLPSTTVYRMLKTLAEQGKVRDVARKGKPRYRAVPPGEQQPEFPQIPTEFPPDSHDEPTQKSHVVPPPLT